MTSLQEPSAQVNAVANRYDHPDVSEAEKIATGIPAVIHAMEHAVPNNAAPSLLTINKHKGFDCPGCAWPEPDQADLNIVEFCENGAKAVAEETIPKKAGPDFWAAHTVEDLREKTDHWLGKVGRITEPMLYDRASGDGHYRPVSWETAFGVIAEQLRDTAPEDAVFYTSGKASNEAAYVFQLLARRMGTNNLPDCSNMCHESTGSALSSTLGLGKGSVTMNDIHSTDLLISVGQNPGTNHPRALTAFSRCKENGGRILAVNPIPETGLMNFREPQALGTYVGMKQKLADDYLQVRLDGDRALFLAINKELVIRDAVDHAFIDQFTTGFDEVREHLLSLDDDELAAAHGIPRAQVLSTVDEIVAASTMIITWTLGVTQHKNAVATIREMTNTLLLTGNIGKPGAGTCPLRGHSNVQGNRTMGVWERSPESFLSSIEDHFGFPVPREHGHDTVDALRAMREGTNRFFMSLGGNLVRVVSDTSVAEQGMASNDLTVHLSTKPNGSHAWPGARSLILPVRSRTDLDLQKSGRQSVTVEDSVGKVHASTGKRRANRKENLKSEMDIICSVGRETFGDDFWQPMIDDYDVIRDHIAATIPGFENYNERLEHPGGFYLPNGPRERRFTTSDGKAHLTVNEPDTVQLREGELMMNTVRTHDQYNSTVYGMHDRYRGIRNGRRVVFVHKDDLRERGLTDGDMVDIVSDWADGQRRAPDFRVVEYSHSRGGCTTYFPEANVVIPLDHTAEESNTPVSKSTPVRLEPTGRRASDMPPMPASEK
ncbi:MAG: FdhF/YdeP family oxidoreductase [Corynebacterium sp.]|uniref:FdhF/YdeP family oxidoreductase n=1 Tax=unclassified Corynebacterium TaxID=2624378 RepID=UPI002648C670|nr:FdhF/YdeP family oxidoreductase [Corynebacterium sp.]MDN5582657.1 FdhF/YdeP family oxidoreductase [Corynebacterium sp.]MDN5720184.1 FdhF/YdeP family oxidoreductase [Corynebacterium sp.]MDN6259084.1 FdhF/YdeP family oxidoreductase [Corynebacterium sp.]MDN6387042.1 FdhF/YdeP family oxidoreductase [Corynebacterium sp.]